MKRFFACLLALVLMLTLAPAALGADAKVERSTQSLKIDGVSVDCPAYNIDGYNYVKLRGLAGLLRDTVCPFEVEYDEAADTVVITRGKPYSGAPEIDDGVDRSATAGKSRQSIVIDGAVRDDLDVWNIGDNNWFRLKDLAAAIGFELSYDEPTRTMLIGTVPMQWNAADYASVYAAISSARYSSSRSGAVKNGGAVMEEAAEAPAATPAVASDSAKAGDYTGTNVQVEGFDEGDIVKTDGQYLYVLRGGQELVILQAAGAETRVVSRTKIGWSVYEEQKDPEKPVRASSENKYPREMFVGGGRVAVISACSSYREGTVNGVWRYESKNYTSVDLYDVSDPAAPKQLASLGQDGYVLGTRMVGGKVYLVTNYWVWNCDENDPGTYVPILYKDGEMRIMPADSICICPGCSSTQYVVLCEYDLAGGACTASQSLLGGGDTLYMNDSGIYVMGSRWYDNVTRSYTESVYTVEEHLNGSQTEIFRFSLTDGLKLAASGKIPGYLESQFSADEYQGSLRLVTTSSDSVYRVFTDEKYGFTNWQYDDREQTNGLYVLGSDLTVIGKVESLAPGERVYSARFDGPIAYFCTFRNVDPLFAVDVSDPAAPKVLSALKISGFSEYLHAWGDGRLFGFGREANEETGWAEELKLVMFNTEDKTNVTVKHTALVDDCDYSEALYDHKAFFIDPAHGIIGFVGDKDYYVYSYDDANGFRKLCSFSFETWPGSVRGFRIGDAAYVVGEQAVYVLETGGWTRLQTLNLAG